VPACKAISFMSTAGPTTRNTSLGSNGKPASEAATNASASLHTASTTASTASTGTAMIPFSLTAAYQEDGTTTFSVAARGIWQHGPSLLFLTIGIWLLAPPASVVRIALAAFPLGFAVWNRPPNGLLVLPLAVYVLWRERRAFIPFIAVAAIPAALMGWYSLHYWGSITNLGQYPAGDWFRGRVAGGVAGLLFSPNRGLLVFTPLFAVSVVMLFVILRHPRREPLLAALAAGVVATVLLYAKWWSWWGGTREDTRRERQARSGCRA